MGKLYVISDPSQSETSRQQRLAALRREQSGEYAEGLDPTLVSSYPCHDALDPTVAHAARDSSRFLASRPRLRLLIAYVLGPLSIGLWTTGRARLAWIAIGGASAAAAVALVLKWTELLDWSSVAPNGPVLWLAAVTGVPVVTLGVWGRAIAAAALRHHPLRSREPGRPSRFVRALASLVPGLDCHFAGRPRKAAAAFALLGPVLAAVIILGNWWWLWGLREAPTAGPLTANTMEITFLAAVAFTALWTLFWLSHVVRAARLLPTKRRAPRAQGLGFLPWVILAAVAGMRAGSPVAGSLHEAATTLKGEGFRLIPLGLCTLAVELDPGQPVYLVDVATLNDTLGRTAQARDARQALSERATEYRAALRVASPPVATAEGAPVLSASGSMWPRIQALQE